MTYTAPKLFRQGTLAPIMNPGRDDLVAVLQAVEAAILTQLGGPLPEDPNLVGVQTVLDLRCGSGGWIVEAAPRYRHLSFTGVDNDPRQLGYAMDRARTLPQPDQVQFAHFDITQGSWPIEDHSFDLVNAQFLQGVLRTDHWSRVLQECQRVLRPGGRVRLTEAESTITNSRAYMDLHTLLVQVLQQEGHSFATGNQSNGITHMLSHFLVGAGFEDIDFTPNVIDYSVSSTGHYPMCEVLLRMFAPSLFGQEIVQRGFLSRETYQNLYEQALQEVFADDFCACTYFLTVSGQKL